MSCPEQLTRVKFPDPLSGLCPIMLPSLGGCIVAHDTNHCVSNLQVQDINTSSGEIAVGERGPRVLPASVMLVSLVLLMCNWDMLTYLNEKNYHRHHHDNAISTLHRLQSTTFWIATQMVSMSRDFDCILLAISFMRSTQWVSEVTLW